MGREGVARRRAVGDEPPAVEPQDRIGKLRNERQVVQYRDDRAPAAREADEGFEHPILVGGVERSEEHTSELQSLMRISYAVFCLKKKKQPIHKLHRDTTNKNNNHKNHLRLHDT